MLGKRVSKSARTVIACDASISPDEVVFPLEFAKTLYMKEVVRPYNFKRLEGLFKNGPNIYPGAEYIVKKDGHKYHIGNVNVTMEEGDILYRHLQDGDPVLMNR